MESNEVAISFVIPHKGREEMLKQTLESVAAQQFDLSKVLVVVVTQNASLQPDTLPADKKLNVEVLVRPESETVARLRNLGAGHSNSEYLAFLDADIELAPDWISTMLNELNSKSSRVLVSGSQACTEDAPSVEKVRVALSNAAVDTDVRFLPGANLFLKRSSFAASGGFPEHLITCEDYFFTDRVHMLGELYFTSKSRFIHLGEDKDYFQMFKKEIWRGRSNLQTLKGRKMTLGEIPSIVSPLWVALGMLLSLVLALAAQPAGFLIFVLSMVPVLLYAARLVRVSRGVIGIPEALTFYVFYFPARAIGMVKGLLKLT